MNNENLDITLDIILSKFKEGKLTLEESKKLIEGLFNNITYYPYYPTYPTYPLVSYNTTSNNSKND